MPPEIDSKTIVLAAILIAIFAALFLGWLIPKLLRFKHDLEIYNMEISRTTGAERQHWREERRRLWLSLLPFYRE